MVKYTKEDFIEKAKKIHDNKYDYSKVEYVNSQTKVCIVCPKHGDFWLKPNGHLNGVGCAECSGLKKWTTEKFIEKAKEVHGNKYTYTKTKYINKRTNVIITCPIHGDFTQNPHNHVSQHQGCPKCGKKYAFEYRKNDYKHFIEESKKRFGDIYEFPNIENEYENSHSTIHIKCKKCENIFEKIACDHLTSPHGGCLKCYSSKSKGEEEIGEFLINELGKDNVVFRTRSVLKGLELDIFIPNLKIAIEYNGIYWHSNINKEKNYHLLKTEFCEQNGIKLIQVFEDEYGNNKDIVLNKLKHIVHKNNCLPKIMGRKCVVHEIDRKTALYFLNNYHIQGFTNSTVYLGAYFNEIIIGVMTFIKRKDEWELNRFATDYNYICQGVGGKMFNYFLTKYKPIIVKSFADRRWTNLLDDNLYNKLGFTVDSILKPDYRYVITKRGEVKRAHKFNFRKNILVKKYGVDENMSEKEMTESLKFPKIYDCGLIKYIWKNTK